MTVPNPTGYLITSYGEMITGEPRMSAYAEALRQAVTPGCTVIDIGAGSGIFSLLACQYGAGSVIAIDPHDSVELLRASAITNGFADRITIFKGISTDYVGARADVIISDLRSCLPLFEQHIPSIVDARQRLLAPDGRLIPARDDLFVALVHDPEFYVQCVEPWLSNRFELDLTDGHGYAVNQWRKANFTPINLISEPQVVQTLDYASITDPDMIVDFALVADAAGEAHGFLVWFDAELAPGIGFSNAPGEPEQIYGQTFFPLERATQLDVGDRVEIRLRANLLVEGYVWSWASKVFRNGSAVPDVTFSQSTFLSRILAPEKLRQRSSSYVPFVSSDHAVDRHCLSLFNGEASLGEIADAMVLAFPGRFDGIVEALAHVSKLAARYGERAERGTL